MVAAIARRNSTAALALAPAAVLFGAVVHARPELAFAAVAGAIVAALALSVPTANLVLLLFLTAIVPYGLQNRLGIGGGAGTPGLLPSDAILLGALVSTALVLLRRPPPRTTRVALALVLAFLAIATAAFAQGLLAGHGGSAVGVEYRILLGLATFVLAVPVLSDPVTRRRLFRWLLVLAFLLGLWGLTQWVVNIPFSLSGDAGVREGVQHTTAGRGQIQGGLFVFPIAVTMAMAVLVSGAARGLAATLALLAIVVMNGISLLLTYERTFWVATVLALFVIVAKVSGLQRVRALVMAPVAIGLVAVLLGSMAPDTLTAARERLLSLGQYGTDSSVRYRLVESRHVIEEIKKDPLTGAGLAASIHWGRPWEGVPPRTVAYAHNGYLWLVWKVGLIGAALLLTLIGWAVLVRGPTQPREPLVAAMRTGAQASLLALLLVSITFPAFNSLSAVPMIGLLLALVFAFRPEPAAAR